MSSKQYITSFIGKHVVYQRTLTREGSLIQYIYSRLHTASGSQLLTLNYLPLEFFPPLLQLLQPAVLLHAASSALLTVQLPFAFLQFVSLALRRFGLPSQIADRGSEGFEAIQARALACLRPGL